MSTWSFSYWTLSWWWKYVQTNTSAYSTELSIPFNQKKYTISFVLSFPTNSTWWWNGATVIELYNSSYWTSMTRFVTHWTKQQTWKLFLLDHSALLYWPSISNSWHHYVFTFDWTTARMYVDWQLYATTNVRANSNLSSMTFRINNVMNNSAYQYTWNNKLWRLIFENVVWSWTDISKDFNHIKNKYWIS